MLFVRSGTAGYWDRPVQPLSMQRWPDRQLLSAAQPRPNTRGGVYAFVANSALCRAALNGATSSPTADIMLA
jgi:hypothetical protein